MQTDIVGNKLRGLYQATAREPIPAGMAALLDQMGEVEPGAMGGNVPGSLPFAGGELAAA